MLPMRQYLKLKNTFVVENILQTVSMLIPVSLCRTWSHLYLVPAATSGPQSGPPQEGAIQEKLLSENFSCWLVAKLSFFSSDLFQPKTRTEIFSSLRTPTSRFTLSLKVLQRFVPLSGGLCKMSTVLLRPR